MTEKQDGSEADLQRTRFVCQQVGQSAQFLWDGTGSDHGAGDALVFHDNPAVRRLPHVQVDSQTTQTAESAQVQRKPDLFYRSVTRIHNVGSSWPTQYLMGMMYENSTTNRKRFRNQGPTNPCSATMTTERITWARNRALVRRFSSRSKRPTCGDKRSKVREASSSSSSHQIQRFLK